MTCIIGIKEKDSIYLAADSVAVSGQFKEQLGNPKIFRNGSFLFGYAGSPRMAQILRYTTFPECCDWDIERYMCSTFIDTLRQSIKNKGNIVYKNGIDELDASSFLAVYKDRLFIIEENFQVIWVKSPFICIGSGKYIATGAMEALGSCDLETVYKLKKALEITSKFICSVEEPFVIERY